MDDDKAVLRLTIEAHYTLGRTDIRDLKDVLVAAADHLYDNGLLSGDTEADVENWTSSVIELDDAGVPVPGKVPQSTMTRVKADSASLPTEAGFWWAKTGKTPYFNLIVEVFGDAPFLRLRGWNLLQNQFAEVDPHIIEEWGPRIAKPRTDANDEE
jgi:hypothetical protein